MLIMREAYYGTTRFDDFAHRVGITKAAASARLSELVDLGLLTRRPYREPGQRIRDEYVLTEAGIDFMPVVWAMFQWGQRHLPGSRRLRLTHLDCGADASSKSCTKGHPVPPDELGVELVRRNGARRLSRRWVRNRAIRTQRWRRTVANFRTAEPQFR